ncbi:DUF1285 domain-containing protein [Parahaliea sp. F7430]|uniref:DUF1285 domain-containing protein n=1 Tax=Sediminihaliea albiluteola TaxID=2758564 RepID=A0A7W2TUN2_9GAMM|nr:DUF1285 domain-containing protein [Sediminihaliea albiluteola]MBA6412195.1 DUF1285 domain-containing protein [Sediminihaliea albiluteola]
MADNNPQEQALAALVAQLPKKRNFDSPPLQLWDPPLSGDIDIVIRSDGSWWHEGSEIRRPAIVRVFASILRREADGDYYLVTPAEKWRIKVDAHPLLIVDFERSESDSGTALIKACLNTGKQYPLDKDHPLFLEPEQDKVAGIALPHGLSALCSRSAWYRLVEDAEEEAGVLGVRSAGIFWPLQ